MIPQIFLVEDNQLRINDQVLSIPELRAIMDFYPDPVPPLQYVRQLCDPYGPYNNTPEDEKEDIIYGDYPGNYTPQDQIILEAVDKLRKLYTTPIYQHYLDNKILLESLGKWSRTAVIAEGRDGNLRDVLSQLSSLGKIMANFKSMERIADEELKKNKTRGNQFEAYDMDEEEDDD